ncbi:hypothetical protein AwWohl_01460 [Gammaproteobacteria bacterium]|nr:hypothetical protein AwWohl_01460 [Gammaproteobacteria bacterium]
MIYQQVNSSERQRKSRQQLKELGGRHLDLQLEPQNALYLKKLSIVHQISYSQLIRNIIHETAVQIRYPLDVWLKRIYLPHHLDVDDILNMPEGTVLYLGSFKLVNDDRVLESNTSNEFTLLLYKKVLGWLIYIKWIYDGRYKLERFPKRIDRFGMYYSFLIEDGYVIFDEVKKDIEHQISIFCRYAAHVIKQIDQKIEYKGYKWITSADIPFILLPDD